MSFNIPDGWKSTIAKDYCVRVADGTHESPKFLEAGYPLVTTRNLKNGHVDLSDVNLISKENFDEINKRSKVHQWDVIFTMIGTVGELCLVQDKYPAYAIKNVGLFKCGSDELSGGWLYYFLSSPLAKQYINARKKGSTQQYISLGELRKMPIMEPVLKSEKEQIVFFLRSIDRRIDLLRETNSTLEAIAQALFKSWFVDFDPVRAKQEGRAPEGMKADTAALFPDSFEESELGLMPKGWHISPVGQMVECMGGGTPDTKNPDYWAPEEHCWTTPKDLSGIQSPVLLGTERKLSANGLRKISSGLLPAGTLLMSSRAPIGYLAITQVPLAINQGYIAMPPGGHLAPLYMLFWCKQNMETIKGRSNGSTFMEISKKAFRPIPVVVPPASLLEVFATIVDSLFARLVENEKQAQTLATLRDTLLPRLISGQLRLLEADTILEAA